MGSYTNRTGQGNGLEIEFISIAQLRDVAPTGAREFLPSVTELASVIARKSRVETGLFTRVLADSSGVSGPVHQKGFEFGQLVAIATSRRVENH